jgi:DNA-binding transcriptional ArsR family regulator
MPKSSTDVDQVFHALADVTRRGVVERLELGPTSTSDLLDSFSMSLPSLTHHLSVLEEARLVSSTKQGRVRTYRLSPDGLAVAETWLSARRTHWESRLDQLDRHLQETKENAS